MDSRGLAARHWRPLRQVAFGVSVMNMVAPLARYFFGCRVQLNIAYSGLTSAERLRSPGLVVLPIQQNPPLVITQRLHIHTGSISYLAATEPALAHGASRWARVVNAFSFGLTTSSALRILLPRGPVDRRLATRAVHWRMRPVAAEIWGRCSPSHSAF